MIDGLIPEFELAGSHEDVGSQHGHYLTSKIEDTVEFYASLFGLRRDSLFRIARCFQQQISVFSQSLVLEIEALASAARIDPLWIYALNARSEILNSKIAECTAIYFPESAILGQNWDWSPVLEELVCVLDIKVIGKPALKMVTEPGIVGKMGMNEAGLGICLNILANSKKGLGVPIHVLLRAMLECRNFELAIDLAKKYPEGKASNLLVADSRGRSCNLEFAGDRLITLEGQGVQCHTNHYLGAGNDIRDVKYEGSDDRLARAYLLAEAKKEEGVAGMQSLLTDKEHGNTAICSRYHANSLLGEYGTLVSLVMALEQRVLWIKKANSDQPDFQKTGL